VLSMPRSTPARKPRVRTSMNLSHGRPGGIVSLNVVELKCTMFAKLPEKRLLNLSMVGGAWDAFDDEVADSSFVGYARVGKWLFVADAWLFRG